MPDEKKGIKESLEVLEGVKVLAVAGKQIAKDGLGKEDLPVLLGLVKEHQKLSDAVAGIGDVDDELKDLSPEEIAQLAAAALGIVKALKEAK